MTNLKRKKRLKRKQKFALNDFATYFQGKVCSGLTVF